MAVILIPPGGGGGGGDHSTLIHLSADDHPQYLTSGRGDLRYEQLGAVLNGLKSLSSGSVVKVHPNYPDDDDLLQYTDISTGLAKAHALAISSGDIVLVQVLPGTHPVVDTLQIQNGVAVVFDPGALIDLSGWTGIAGNPLFELSGLSLLYDLFLWSYAFAPHPFTGHSWIKIKDAAPYTLAFLVNVQHWDTQGGATYLVDVLDGLLGANDLFIFGGFYSSVSTGASIVGRGNCAVHVESGTKVSNIFGNCLKCFDNLALQGPNLYVHTTQLTKIDGGDIISVSPNTNLGVGSGEGSIIELSKFNAPYTGVGYNFLKSMVGATSIFQERWVNPDILIPDPEKYSLDRGLEYAHLKTLDPSVGHRHGSLADDGGPVVTLSVRQARKDLMPAGVLAYFDGMNSSNGVPAGVEWALAGIIFENDNVVTRNLKIWQYDPSTSTLTLIDTIAVSGVQRIIKTYTNPGTYDGADHLLIAALESGTGAAANATVEFVLYTPTY
jgi:hypothetical protein